MYQARASWASDRLHAAADAARAWLERLTPLSGIMEPMPNTCEPGPVTTVGELIQRLQQLPPETPLLVSGYESGCDTAVAGLTEVQELSGLGWYHGRYQDPAEAARQVEGGEWKLMKDGVPPVPVGEPFTAVVLRRIEHD
jgi:hypothetical protein